MARFAALSFQVNPPAGGGIEKSGPGSLHAGRQVSTSLRFAQDDI
ncbi:MAG: hypothetical protein WCF93_04005 [Candidatus Moraniibacteriota bacterium]